MSSLNAPPVSYRLGRSRFLAWLLTALWLLALAVTLAWWGAAGATDLRPWLGAAALVLATAVVFSGWRRMPEGRLQWDGVAWSWESPAYPAGTPVARLRPVLDLQRLVLIRMRNPAEAQWLVWADAATDPRHWLDFRRALHGHAEPDGVPLPAAGRDAQP